ncbi:MAG: hypothetical protein ACYCVB_02515, partial [Bacilli bacterium]
MTVTTDFAGVRASTTTGKTMRLRRFFGIDIHAAAQHHQYMKMAAPVSFANAMPAWVGVIYCARRELCEALFEQGRNI